MKKMYLIITGISFAALSGWAVKAKPGIVEYMQPDGSRLKVRLYGDEQYHYATDVAGNLLMINAAGEYVPADETEIKKFKTRGTTGARYRYSSSVFPTLGEPHSLVILVEYPDHGFNVANPAEYFNDFLNGDNFTRDGATGSVRKYYSENSNGAFVPTFDVYGPVKLSKNRKHYGSGINEANACEMVIEGVKALDDLVDFSQYDHNGDGYVDSVYVIYSDKGEADGGPSESVWPYSWELEEEGVTLIADGVKFNTYGVSNELQSDGDMEGIGVFTHEFGHVLGLPDLYNTSRSSDTTTPDDWSIMDSGSYLNDSRTPPNLSSFERYSLGWCTPLEIYATGEYSIENLASSNKAYLMTSDQNDDEFYLLENRQQTGWDKYLPHHGMLVWHIDFVQKKWDSNVVNNTPSHQYVELVRADNDKSLSNLKADCYPGSRNITEFGNNTLPALKTWLGLDLNVTSIYNITETDGLISFNATAGEDRTPTVVVPVTDEETIDIIGNTVTVGNGNYNVYDISGKIVGNVTPETPLMLPRGIYIVAGKKILIK